MCFVLSCLVGSTLLTSSVMTNLQMLLKGFIKSFLQETLPDLPLLPLLSASQMISLSSPLQTQFYASDTYFSSLLYVHPNQIESSRRLGLLFTHYGPLEFHRVIPYI